MFANGPKDSPILVTPLPRLGIPVCSRPRGRERGGVTGAIYSTAMTSSPGHLCQSPSQTTATNIFNGYGDYILLQRFNLDISMGLWLKKGSQPLALH